MSIENGERSRGSNAFQLKWAIAGVGLAAAYLIARDHWTHVVDYLPYLLIIACPLMHLFMRHGHGGHENHAAQASDRTMAKAASEVGYDT